MRFILPNCTCLTLKAQTKASKKLLEKIEEGTGWRTGKYLAWLKNLAMQSYFNLLTNKIFLVTSEKGVVYIHVDLKAASREMTNKNFIKVVRCVHYVGVWSSLKYLEYVQLQQSVTHLSFKTKF